MLGNILEAYRHYPPNKAPESLAPELLSLGHFPHVMCHRMVGQRKNHVGSPEQRWKRVWKTKMKTPFKGKTQKTHPLHNTSPGLAMLQHGFLKGDHGDQQGIHKFQEQISISHGWNQFIKNSDHLKFGGITNTTEIGYLHPSSPG